MAPVDVRKKLEQIRRNKNKNKTGARNGSNNNNNSNRNKTNTIKSTSNVKDLRTLIAKKNKTKGGNDWSPELARTSRGRITKLNRSNNSRDLRETNRKLASRKNEFAHVDQQQQSRNQRSFSANRNGDRTTTRSVVQSRHSLPVVNKRTLTNGQSVRIGKKIVQQQQYYVPPHMQRQQPTYIIAPAAAPKSNLAMDNVQEFQSGASVLISNLTPAITQSDIIELFGDIGVMTAVNMINQTTALVTYQNSSDAVRAVKVYHNRLLDGTPMLVNMMPNSS